jgi:proline iminopeptidase
LSSGDFGVVRSGAGFPALLVHGGPGLNDYLEDLADLLVDRVESIRYTQRGVAPGPLEGPYTIAQHVDDARDVLDREEVDVAVVIGHSWGGYLAAAFTATHPERVGALVSIDGLGCVGDGGWAEFDHHFERSVPPDAAQRAAEIDRRLLAGGGTDEEAGEMLRICWPYYFADPSSAPEPPAFRLSAKAYGETAADAKAALERNELATAVRTLDTPALFLRGEFSGFPRSAVQGSASAFPNGRYVEIAGAGHFLWVERPQATLAAITAFLQETAAAAGAAGDRTPRPGDPRRTSS